MSTRKRLTWEELGFQEDQEGNIRIEEIVIPPAPPPALTHDIPDSRLIITHLTVENFKSYAGVQDIGPFDKNFTAVVGPNGSGKSNVIDALMFVFGQKAKNIRAKKINALIHKSSKYPDLTSCTVAVHFAVVKEGEGKGVIVKDSRFTLSRTVLIDASSYYEMDGKRMQYKDVRRILKAYGIDMDYTRFLIMQGEIESISLMKPKGQAENETGMLEYIEDIIGSNRLIEPIEHFKDLLKERRAEEAEKLKILNLVAKEKQELEMPKNAAVAYLRLDNKRISCENSILICQRRDAEKDLEKLLDKKKKFTEEFKALKEDMEKLQASKKSLENDLNGIVKEHGAVFKKCEELKEQFKQLEREDAANNEDGKHAKEKKQSLNTNLQKCQEELNKLTKQCNTFEKETEELKLMKVKLEEDKIFEEKKAAEVMGSLKQETFILQEKKDKIEIELKNLKENVYDIKSEMDLLQSELNICVSGSKKEKEKLSSLISNYEKTTENLKKEESLLKQEEEQIKQLQNEISSLKEELTDSKEKELSFSQQLRDERTKYGEARNSQQSSQNTNRMLKALFKERNEGRLPGVLGRLGDLGSIDLQYDVAVSTASSRLDNIVTDDMDTARECVEFLKIHNLGYTTFIGLTEMKKYEPHCYQKISTPENVPRLLDLIKVKDTSLLPAFFFAFHNTLVAKDLDQATRIALRGSQRYRVVTLKGEIIEPTGPMSGGGGRPIRGRMGQTVVENVYTDEEIARMSTAVNELTKEVSKLKKLCVSIEEQISQKTSKISSLQHSVKKRRMNNKAYKEQVEMLASQIEEQKKKTAESTVDEEKVNELEAKIKTKNKNYQIAVEEATATEEKVSKLQAEILKLTKGNYSKAKKTVDQLKKKCDEVAQNLTRSIVNIRQSKTKIKKLETTIQNITKDIEANDKFLQDYKQKQEAYTIKGTEITEEIKLLKGELAVLQEKQSKLKKKIEEIQGKEHQMKRDEIENKNTMKKYDASESEIKAIIRSINAKMSKLKLNAVEEDPTELPSLSEEDIAKLNLQSLTSELEIFKVQLEEKKVDLSAIEEYKKKVKSFEEKMSDVQTVRKQLQLQGQRYDELRRKRLHEFMAGFSVIAKKLKEIYQMLTIGGDAEVELVDQNDPFAGGIELSVKPPRKSWKAMRNLSGGEKTLSSLALVFALHYYRPTPFYVMDEIDAALDVRNVAIVGYFLKETTKNAQFIIVSLRNVMNELSDNLLGIYKINNCTKNISISNVSEWNKQSERPDRN
ncbi:structural maintenance of chromosomes protein 4-like [Argiope bruennichi]|uniref:structural maintenance of chromosomes protein 4-like n=1 Tax=Argiope bruennichi TaxID=94029 RepID=UPI002494E7CE|nr:structural maintenance of chromosomes protein 4-like [Argiope bruennichi]